MKISKDNNLHIGNTSNPVINRTGIIQPWAYQYLPNKTLKFKIKTINTILSIFKNYISHGNTSTPSVLASEFWYGKNLQIKPATSINYAQFFKRFYYSNSILGIEHSFLIRKQTPEFFWF